MIKRKLWYSLACVLLAGCSKPTAPDEAAAEDAGASALVRVEQVQAGAMARHVDAYGLVGFPPEFQHTLNAAAESRVAQVLVSAGESVLPGQRLMQLQPSATTAVALAKARTDASFAASELARAQRLHTQQLATNAELAAARQGQANAQAALTGLQQMLGASNGLIVANQAGVIASVDVQQGDIVAAGAPVIHLSDKRALRVRVGVEPTDLAEMSEGQKVEITAVYDPSITTTGRVSKLVSQVDPQTRLGQALVDLDGSANLLPGATVRAAIEVDRHPGALAIPRSAVLQDEAGTPYVFIVIGGKASRVVIKTGQDDGKRVEVVDGLKAGDQVVVEGNYELEDGMAVHLAPKAP